MSTLISGLLSNLRPSKKVGQTNYSDYKTAQQILGIDFITPEEVAGARPGIVYSDDQITTLARFLPPKKVLEWCAENYYALFPGPPRALSTLEIEEINPDHFYSRVHESRGWYHDQYFARVDNISFGWHAFKKVPVENSVNKKFWDKQCSLLKQFERVPNTAEMSWFIPTYFVTREIQLFENVYVNTLSIDSAGNHVLLGHFNTSLVFNDRRDPERQVGDGNIGLAAALKLWSSLFGFLDFLSRKFLGVIHVGDADFVLGKLIFS